MRPDPDAPALLPHLRRHHRAAEAHHPHPQRLRVQRTCDVAPPPSSTPTTSTSAPCPVATTSRWPVRASWARSSSAPRWSCFQPRAGACLRHDRGRRGHARGRRSRGGPAVARPPGGGGRRPAGHPAGAPGRRLAAARRVRCPRPAGPGRHAAAGLRHGRGPHQHHPARRPGGRSSHHAGTPGARGRRGPDPRPAGQRRPRRDPRGDLHPWPLHPARLLPRRRAQRPGLHRRTAGTAAATSSYADPTATWSSTAATRT